jgi:PAS domain S-box-containing protein
MHSLSESYGVLQAVIEGTPDAVFVKDPEGRYLLVNAACARFVGHPVEEIVGRLDEDLYPPDTARRFREEDAAVMRSGETRVFEGVATGASGVQAYRVTKGVFRDDAGRVVGLFGVSHDITDRIRAEEERAGRVEAEAAARAKDELLNSLRASEERYRSLLENANDIIYSHDLQGNYLTINRAGERITGYTRDEILGGLNFARVVAPDHLARARAMMEEKLRSPATPTVYELDIITKDGRRLTLELSTRLAFRDGRPARIEGIGRDVTERKRAAALLEQLFEREREARRAAEEALLSRRDVERRLRAIADASATLLVSPRLGDVLPSVLELARRLVSADAYAIWRHRPEESRWEVVAAAGLSDEYKMDQIEITTATPSMLDEPLIVEDVFAAQVLAERAERYRREGIRSMLTLPLRLHGRVSGTLVFYFRQPHRFTEAEVGVATALTNLSATAIGTAELYEEQSRLRAAAESAGRRATFLAEATAVLSSSLDYERTLDALTRLAVPAVADWCGVDIVSEAGRVERLAVAHVDPAKVEWARELTRRYPYDESAQRGLASVLRTGRSELYPDVPDQMLAAAAKDEEHLRMLRGIGFRSVMIVPLAVRDRVFGAISFVTAESERRYTQSDLAFAEDLAHRAALAVENARLYREAREVNRLKDEFLATLSHELRTPLTAIIGWTHLIRSGGLTEEATARALETVERNARTQSQLVGDLLDVSRIVTGKMRLDMGPVDLAPVVAEAVASIRPAAEARGLRLRAELDPRAGRVTGDADRLRQVIWNLLSNAVKFTPEGGAVTVRGARRGGRVEIEVSDTGQGIAPEFLPYVFDRFRQADQSTTRAHGGLGLGLSIVRHLVELHGGTVRAESDGEGRGATFTVSLPAAKETADVAALEESHDRPGASRVGERGGAAMLEGLRVLVADDDEDACLLLAALLRRRGAEVVAARSAAEAFEAFTRARFDVLVSDIGMPGEDGYSLIRRVRALPEELGGRTPAAALTAYARESDRQSALEAGFQVHLAKPADPAELLNVVAALARERG